MVEIGGTADFWRITSGSPVIGGTQVIGEDHSVYVRLRPAWSENLLWLSVIAIIVSATIFLLH